MLCHRPLKSTRSMQIGLGPKCARKVYQGVYLSADVGALIAEKYRMALTEERVITPVMQNVSNRVGGELAGLEFRVKTFESFVRKVHADTVLGKEPHVAVREVYDLVRYTVVQSPESYKKTVESALREFAARGWRIVRIKNFWRQTDTPYRGINVVVETGTSFRFEVQFHTPESFDGKMKMHSLYEIARLPETSMEENAHLMSKMFQISSGIQIPKEAEKIGEDWS